MLLVAAITSKGAVMLDQNFGPMQGLNVLESTCPDFVTYETNPTKQNYSALDEAYQFFNAQLFAGKLPGCLITLQRKAKAYGYFAGNRFGSTDGGSVTDEIALNPSHFKNRTTEEVLSTLVHEMCHLWQHHYGKPSRSGYHNREWANKMREIGLIPSDTGQSGGKQTGQSMTHYIEPGDLFERHCRALIETGYKLPFVELWGDAAARLRKAKNKTKFTCLTCGASAWGKPDLKIVCGDCGEIMPPHGGT